VERARYPQHAFGNRDHRFWCLISGTIVVVGFNSACIEACSLSWPFPSPGHPVKD
jgi:hypothetical protein